MKPKHWYDRGPTRACFFDASLMSMARARDCQAIVGLGFKLVTTVISFCRRTPEAARNMKDTSATNFPSFLMEGRWWVLEDLAIEDDTNSNFFKSHPLFKHSDWPEYRAKIRTLHNTPPAQFHQVGCFPEDA